MAASIEQPSGGAATPMAALPAAGSTHGPVGRSGDAMVDALLGGTRWQSGGGTTTITYSFADAGSQWRLGYGNEEPDFWAGDFSAAEQAVIRQALGAWTAVADIRLVEVADGSAEAGTLRFGRSLLPSTAWAYLPGGEAEHGDVWLGQQRFPTIDDPELADWVYAPGTWRYFTLMHEVGHALGLLHTHDGDGVGAPLDPAVDWIGASIMSYRSHPGQGALAGYGVEFYPTTPMGLDVAAIQFLYGAAQAAPGNTSWRWAEGARVYQTIWDSGGIDTLDWSNQTSSAVIRLAEGSWSELGQPYRWSVDGGGSLPGTLFLAEGTWIENALGGQGSDRIEGNHLANRLEGLGGADVLLGFAGPDALFGGEGDDRLEGGEGDDLASGHMGADVILGGEGDDALYGFAGNDRLYGEAGRDSLAGGDGADRLYGDGGDDLLDGGSGDDWLYGGIGDNRLIGGAGADLLAGGGGSDWLVGGTGNDRLDGGSGDDLILAGEGDDLVTAWYGQDVIDGGAGTDTLEVGFAASGYRLEGTLAAARLVDIMPDGGDLGLDLLRSVEIVRFLDRTLVWQGGQWQG
ncbi:MAG TPA: M10 family metallopeptidase [Geminicoccus sp.]|uniref:M10 family metallopeptidase n=1 Tax=Geminicoccus sp. TaxID=2024832 RepID=UPI002BC90E60|nr:M10 family metallopeptidase [Geminicoccus sp.]HWL71909.1 M10 family metallopeptidase [Geminicoccus sp.]